MATRDIRRPTSGGRSLAAVLRDGRATVLAEWERGAREIPRARDLDRTELIDQLPELLEHIAQVAESALRGESLELPMQVAERHAAHRLDQSFDLSDVIAELHVLRQATLKIWKQQGGPTDLDEVRVLDHAVDTAIFASVQLYTSVRDRALAGLDKIASAILESTGLDDLLHRLLVVLKDATPAIDMATIWLRDDDTLRVRSAVGTERDIGFAIRVGDGFAGQIAERREAMTCPDGAPAGVTRYGVPLVEGGHLIGVAEMGSRKAAEFSTQDRRAFSAMATRATTAICHHVVREKADFAASQFRTLADNMAQLAWMADASGSIFWYNERWFRYTGTTLEEMNGRWHPVHHPEHVERFTAEWQRALAAGDSWEDTVPLRSKHGYYRWFLAHATPIRDAGGRIVRWFGTYTDVTNQRFLDDATALLSRSLEYEPTLEQLTKLAIPQLADWCMVDLVERDRVHRVAVAHVDPVQAAAARDYAKTYIPSLTADTEIARVLRAGEPHLIAEVTDAMLVANARSDEQRQALAAMGIRSWMSAPLSARGKTLGAVSFMMTTSERRYRPSDLALAVELGKRAGIAVDNARLHREAQDAVRVREDVLAIVSHDLRNPLSAIDLGATLLMQQHKADPHSRKQLEVIRRSTDRMEHLIDDLLDMASINAGKLALHPVHEDVGRLVAEVLDMHEPLASERQISIIRECETEGVRICCDRNRIAQAFGNILGNAIKFCRPGDVIFARGARIGDQVRITVADTGPGIASADLERIFEPYWTAGRSKERGTGLGLFITRALVEAHGGQLAVESTEGQGASFTVMLPVAEASPLCTAG